MFNSLIDHVEDWETGTFMYSEESRNAASAGKQKLLKYYQKTTEAYLVALVLDPRLKNDYFTDNNWEDEIINDEVTPA